MIRFFLLYQDDPIKQKQAIGNSFITAFIGAIIAPLLLTFISWKYQLSLSSEYLYIASASIASFTLFSLVLAYHRMKERVTVYLILFCSQNIIATVLTLFGIWAGYKFKALWYANMFSLFLFIPLFFKIWMRYRIYSLQIFKQQLSYSTPLLLYSFIYTSFISLDRWYIQNYLGFEQLGVYALLWRFGALFQFAMIALMDTWPLLIFNAQKEANGLQLIAQLTRVFLLTIGTIGLCGIIGSHFGILFFLPQNYHFLIIYLPSFFIACVALEMARVLQAGFGLTTKTHYIPLIAVAIIPFQSFLLFLAINLGLWGVFFANIFSFFIYGCLSFFMSNKLFPTTFSWRAYYKIVSSFFFSAGILQIAALNGASFIQIIFISLLWPTLIFLTNSIDRGERSKLGTYSRKFTIRLLKFLIPPMHKRECFQIKSLLYLRTDLCSEEIVAGGSVAHTLGVINGFKKHGLKILIASCAIQSILRKEYTEAFMHLTVPPFFCFLRWKLNYLRWRLESFFSTFFFAFTLRERCKNSFFDSIYQRYSLLNATGVILSVRHKIPLILEYNGSDVWQFDQLAPKKWFKLNWLARLIEQINLEYASSIVVVSQVLKEDLISKGINPLKILVNPNGVDTDLYDPEKLINKRNQIRKELGIEDKFVFGFVGTFSFWHGIEVIAQIIPQIIKKTSHAHFLLIGDGPLKSYIENEIKRANITASVTLTGLVTTAAAREYLSACDSFLCPTQSMPDGSRFFGSPTKMFEYLSMGRPIIASNLEQLKEIMLPSLVNPQLNNHSLLIDKRGILVDSQNHQGFVDAAFILIKSAIEDLNHIGKKNRNQAINNYSWEHHVNKILKFYVDH
ncbi:glycosyltransferase [Candidatus Dependentiae bacterium]|nr:glycosyltransferase [Candidatus Dependentiae bacterium]